MSDRFKSRKQAARYGKKFAKVRKNHKSLPPADDRQIAKRILRKAA